jgi:hypothetical protein
MSAPTYEDANVMLQLYPIAMGKEMQKALSFIWSADYEPDIENFLEKYPLGSKQQRYLSMACGFFETIGALWVNGLFNQKLISDWLAVSMTWERVKGFALGIRERSGNPRLYEHFEALAGALAES